jgi:hypothetical protein
MTDLTPDRFIGDHPPDSFYRKGVSIDCQCARCGSSMGSERCGCENGYVEFCEEEYRVEPCFDCNGSGVNHFCLSSEQWCNANPLPGREDVPRGKIEWFTYPESHNAD